MTSDPSTGPPSDNPVKDTLVAIASAAIEDGLTEFLLIGGNAVIFFGVPRFTEDVDFLIPAAQNQKWRIFLERKGFHFGHATRGFEQFWASSAEFPRIDLMLVDDSTWKKLRNAATLEALTDSLSLWLPAPAHLIAMKLSAAVNKRRAKSEQDWRDVTALIVQCKLSLDDAELQTLIQRYGGNDALAEIRKRLQS